MSITVTSELITSIVMWMCIGIPITFLWQTMKKQFIIATVATATIIGSLLFSGFSFAIHLIHQIGAFFLSIGNGGIAMTPGLGIGTFLGMIYNDIKRSD